MIIEKTFKCSTKDIDSVVCALADEIRDGFTISELIHNLPEVSAHSECYPTFEITLERRG